MASQDIVRAQLEAFNKHDAGAFAACYAANATVADPQFPDLLDGVVISGASVVHELLKEGAATLSF